MTRLSVNINKVALIRNSRGGNNPNIIQVAKDLESFGAEGITVHPRPDERHIRFSDLMPLKEVCSTEFNIEGYPDKRFIQEVLKVIPHQVTLVPDKPGQLTSDHGWNPTEDKSLLSKVIPMFQEKGIRVSLFVDPIPAYIEAMKILGADRVELYTGPYAHDFKTNKDEAISPFILAAQKAVEMEIGLNAGHDLNLENLAFFKEKAPNLLEVSIGHALVCDSLYYGMATCVQMYRRQLGNFNSVLG
jgi:pyridoxine 5-phosphate synthase